MFCAQARRQMTAFVDGALQPRRAARLRAHLHGCPSCQADLEEIEMTVAVQRAALEAPLPELSPEFEAQLGERLAELGESDVRSSWAAWAWKPALVGGLAAAAVLLAAAPLGGPSAVLVPLGIAPPPPKVAREPELFRDYAIIEHLDELENFDTVQAIPLEDEILGRPRDAG